MGEVAEVQARRLADVFDFLRDNHNWNRDFQQQGYRRQLSHCDSELERLKGLLHATVNTQSAPSLGSLGKFWRHLNEFAPSMHPTRLEFTEFLEAFVQLDRRGGGPWERLFFALSAQPGWGKKTAALFVKAAIQVHRGPKPLHFWVDDGIDQPLILPDRVYLPVDAVIIHIFRETALVASPTFGAINKFLMQHYGPEEMLVWDDLWFWGYFTQDSQEGKRTTGWNQDKFWCQLSSPVRSEKKVRELGESFAALLQGA